MGTLRFRLDDRLLLRGLVVSLALHLFVAVFLPLWTPVQSAGLQPVESISFAHLMRAQIERVAAATLPVAVPKTNRSASRVSFARKKSELTAKTRGPKPRTRPQAGPIGRSVAAAPHSAHSQSTVLIARAPASQLPVSAVQSSAQQTPHPDASVDTRAVTSTGQSDRGGVLPMGAQQDPVLDPSVRSRLSAIAHTHVTLLVTVGEDGRTKSVRFDPPLDAQTEREMQMLLADATWDAAVCGGGVSCEGVATIKL